MLARTRSAHARSRGPPHRRPTSRQDAHQRGSVEELLGVGSQAPDGPSGHGASGKVRPRSTTACAVLAHACGCTRTARPPARRTSTLRRHVGRPAGLAGQHDERSWRAPPRCRCAPSRPRAGARPRLSYGRKLGRAASGSTAARASWSKRTCAWRWSGKALRTAGRKPRVREQLRSQRRCRHPGREAVCGLHRPDATASPARKRTPSCVVEAPAPACRQASAARGCDATRSSRVPPCCCRSVGDVRCHHEVIGGSAGTASNHAGVHRDGREPDASRDRDGGQRGIGLQAHRRSAYVSPRCRVSAPARAPISSTAESGGRSSARRMLARDGAR